MDQITFKFPFSKKYNKQDYFVSSNNFSAYKLIDGWPNWPGKWLNVFGENGSGKTHLAKILEKKIKKVKLTDAKKIDDHYEVFTHGGRNATGINAIEWAKKMADFGAGELLITSMDRDGTKKGFDNNLMKSISDAVDIPIIASGGAGSLRHLVDGIKEGEADAVLAASIFHYGEYSIKEAKKYMHEHGIEMRL